MLSRKLFANVNSLFANESEIVILGRHVACQRDTRKGAWPFSLRFIPGWTIRWRERRFIVAGYAAVDAFVTAVATGNFDAQG
jgi:hypothetical protein